MARVLASHGAGLIAPFLRMPSSLSGGSTPPLVRGCCGTVPGIPAITALLRETEGGSRNKRGRGPSLATRHSLS